MQTQTTLKKCFYAFLFSFLGLMLLVGSLLMMPRLALARYSEPITITGNGVSNPITLNLEQLQAMQQYQHIYSTINTFPSKKMYMGEGVKLRDLLALAEIKKDAQLIKFTSTDDYRITLTVKELLEDKRYYFPHLKDNDPVDGSIPGSPADAEEVEPILALKSAEVTNQEVAMNDVDALLLMLGQRAVTEQTTLLFLKNVKTIEVLTTPPQKWDKPVSDTESGDVLAGTEIELSNMNMDADKIYYTTDGTDPTINSPMVNWIASRWSKERSDVWDLINKRIKINQDTVIKAITIGPGKLDSEVVTYTYKIGTPKPQEPSGPPTSLTLNKYQLLSKVGSSEQLRATVGPKNATDTRVTWSSSDTRVATVDNYGLVTFVGVGKAEITAKTVTGDLTATCSVQGTNFNIFSQSEVDINSNSNNQMPKSDQQNLAAIEDAKDTLQNTGQGNSSQGIVGQGNGAGHTDQTPSSEDAVGQTKTDTDQETTSDLQQSQANLQYLMAKENAAINSNNAQTDNPGLQNQNLQVYEIMADTEALLILEANNDLKICMWIILGVLFFSGAGRRYSKYSKEVTG